MRQSMPILSPLVQHWLTYIPTSIKTICTLTMKMTVLKIKLHSSTTKPTNNPLICVALCRNRSIIIPYLYYISFSINFLLNKWTKTTKFYDKLWINEYFVSILFSIRKKTERKSSRWICVLCCFIFLALPHRFQILELIRSQIFLSTHF